jgi:hypothetical protein
LIGLDKVNAEELEYKSGEELGDTFMGLDEGNAKESWLRS